jgi:glycosyltransferase involved in cell wall biosynthesis
VSTFLNNPTKFGVVTSVALGTTVFSRTGDLRELLESVSGEFVDHVYVADDGNDSERETVYNRSHPFDLTVYDLEYDAGVGTGRNRIATEFSEDYLLQVDSDHRIPSNVDILLSQLKARPELGGVGGNIMEPKRGRLWNPGSNFHERTHWNGTVLHRTDPIDDREITYAAGHPLIEFDFTATMMLFRRACLEEYAWDPQFVIGGSHLDFYLGHYHETDWTFATCPEVCFPHYPGGDDQYMANRWSDEKIGRDFRWLREKWDYERIESAKDWFDTDRKFATPSLAVRAKRVYEEEGIRSLVGSSVRYASSTIVDRVRDVSSR